MMQRGWLRLGLAGAWLIAVACLPVSQSNLFAAEADGPLSVIAAIYKEELKPAGTDWMTRKGRPRYLSSGLSSLWTRAEGPKPDDGEMIDFDLATDTNGLTFVGFDPKIEKQTAEAATVAVKLRYKENGQRPGLVRYDVIREGDAWKIDEIRTKAWSLRSILKLNLKTP